MNEHSAPDRRDGDDQEPASSSRLWLEVVILSSSADAGAAAGPAGEVAPGPGAAAQGARPTVLVVAREADLRAYIRDCLDDAGVEILEAPDLADPLASRGEEIDLVILDAASATDGAEPKGGAIAVVPRILVSDEPPRRGAATIPGADTVLMKPFNARRLRAEVRRRLGRDTDPVPASDGEGEEAP